MSFSQKLRVLIADEDTTLARSFGDQLQRRNYEASYAANQEELLRMIRAVDPASILINYTLPPTNGADTLERLKQLKPEIPVIVYSGQSDPDVIFRLSKIGADDFLAMPFQFNDLVQRLNKVLVKKSENEGTQLREQVRRQGDFAMLFGTSPKMEEVKTTIEQVADTTATVLIRGESGTGKEVVARMIYAQSSRREKSFVKVNCAAIPHELLESELFGYEPGAFTGAHRQKLGKFDQANYGTIFLDEISEMHPALQAKLLHVLQDGEFARLGGKRDIAVDVRVLAATNKPLEHAVEHGAFREDLFYRLNVVTIHIPPLRERREEIPVFLDFFLRKYSEFYGKQPAPFSDYAQGRMMEYTWPGNIRELENLVKRYVIVGNESQIIRELATHKPIVSSISKSNGAGSQVPVAKQGSSQAVPENFPNGDDGPSLLEIGRRAAMLAEKEAIERALVQTRWNRRQAAKLLKISYKALLNKIKIIEEENFDAQSKHLHA